MSPAERRGRSGGREGFVLAMVVLLLFAVGMAGAAGYAVVELEAEMARQAAEEEQALAVATAGLERYLGEHLGIPRDSTVYAIGQGTAVVRAQRVGTVDAARGIDLYQVESRGQVVDPVNPVSPARKIVTRYAHLHRRSIGREGAVVLSSPDVDVDRWGQIRGNDHSPPGTCAESGLEHLPGIVYRGSGAVTASRWDSVTANASPTNAGWGSGAAVMGSPAAVVSYPGHAAIYDSVGIRWDVLTDPALPVEFDGAMPDYSTLPPDYYPLVRYQGNLVAGSSWSGRGVLLVTGNISFGTNFSWDGIVIAGSMSSTDRIFWIRGMLIAGLNGGGGPVEFDGFPVVVYDVCSALKASEALAYLEPVAGTWWEVR